jgi:hypothetical protein
MRGFFHKIGCAVLLFFQVFLLLFSLWSFSFGCLAGAIGALLLCMGGWMTFRKKKITFLPVTMMLWGLLNLVLLQHSLNAYDKTRERYMATVQSGGDLAFREKMNVYMLNFFISLGGIPLYPEVGMESLLLMIPCEGGERRFTSDFFLRSEMIRQGFKKGRAIVAWRISDYAFGRESRYALALNPCTLSRTETKDYIDYAVNVRVEYPAKCAVDIFKFPVRITIEEGLFHYLQQEGWLHPYTAVWRTRVVK